MFTAGEAVGTREAGVDGPVTFWVPEMGKCLEVHRKEHRIKSRGKWELHVGGDLEVSLHQGRQQVGAP